MQRGGGRGGLAGKMGGAGKEGPAVRRGIVFQNTLKALVKVLLEAVESDRWQLMRDSAAGPLLQVASPMGAGVGVLTGDALLFRVWFGRWRERRRA